MSRVPIVWLEEFGNDTFRISFCDEPTVLWFYEPEEKEFEDGFKITLDLMAKVCAGILRNYFINRTAKSWTGGTPVDSGSQSGSIN